MFLVRKIRGVDRGQLYAMKVLKKATLKGDLVQIHLAYCPIGIISNSNNNFFKNFFQTKPFCIMFLLLAIFKERNKTSTAPQRIGSESWSFVKIIIGLVEEQ